jgi:hypothetical protein
MTNLIDKRTVLKILKKNNKFMYKFYILHLKSDKYIFLIFLLLMLYFAIRYFKIKSTCNKKDNTDNMRNISYKKNYNTYRLKDGSPLSEKDMFKTQIKSKVRPVPNKFISK